MGSTPKPDGMKPPKIEFKEMQMVGGPMDGTTRSCVVGSSILVRFAQYTYRYVYNSEKQCMVFDRFVPN